MKYFYVAPYVAGQMGENTILDTSVHPPVVHRLHYVFDFWPDETLVRTFPCYVVMEEAKQRLLSMNATGIKFDEVEATMSEEFDEPWPSEEMPKLSWLKVLGQAGRDDFGVTPDHRLVISERALDMLRELGIPYAGIEPFGG